MLPLPQQIIEEDGITIINGTVPATARVINGIAVGPNGELYVAQQ